MNPAGYEFDFETLEKHPELQSDPNFLNMGFGGSLVDEIDKEMMGTIPVYRPFQDSSYNPNLSDTVIVGQNALARSSSYDVHSGFNQQNPSYKQNSGKIRPQMKNFSTDNFHQTNQRPMAQETRFQNLPPSFAGRSSATSVLPYPSRETIQKSRSHGSLDRSKGLMRSDSALERSTSNLSSVEEEEGGQTGEITFSWLEHFKEPNKPKKPVFKACVNCKKAHLACDTSRPCKRCVHLGKTATCVDVEHKKRGRPKSQKNMTPEELEEHQQKIANQYQSQMARSNSDLKNGASFRPNPSINPQQNYGYESQFEEVNHTVLSSNYVEQDQFSEPNDIQFLSVHNLEGIFSLASAEGTIMFGFTEDEFLGKSLYTFIHPDDYMQLTDLHAGIVAIGSDSQKTVSVRFKNKQGDFVLVEIAMAGMKNSGSGSLESIVCSTRLLGPSYSSGRSQESVPSIGQHNGQDAYDQEPIQQGQFKQPWQPQPPQQQFCPPPPQRHQQQQQPIYQRQQQQQQGMFNDQIPQQQSNYNYPNQSSQDYPSNYSQLPRQSSQQQQQQQKPYINSSMMESRMTPLSTSSPSLPLTNSSNRLPNLSSSSSLASSIPANSGVSVNQLQPSASTEAIARFERLQLMRSNSTHNQDSYQN